MSAHLSTQTKRSSERGIAMVSALIVVAALFFAVVAVLRYTSYSASNAGSVQVKQIAFDAAEAGLNDGIRALDVAQGVMTNNTTGGPTTLVGTGASYTWKMVVNNLPYSVPTPGPSGMTVPAKTAYMTAVGSLPNNRSQTLGAIIARATGTKTPGGAID